MHARPMKTPALHSTGRNPVIFPEYYKPIDHFPVAYWKTRIKDRGSAIEDRGSGIGKKIINK